jgi:hypothetical protein
MLGIREVRIEGSKDFWTFGIWELRSLEAK